MDKWQIRHFRMECHRAELIKMVWQLPPWCWVSLQFAVAVFLG